MNSKSLVSLLALVLALTALPHCGGGGGGGGGAAPAAPQPTKAVLDLSTAISGVMPASTIITAYNVTITLPAGVTVKSVTNPPETDAGVVTASGSAAGLIPTTNYTPATGGVPGTIKIIVADASGFAAGEFSRVNCDIAPGTNLTASDFQQPTLNQAIGFTDPGSTPDLTDILTVTATVSIK